MPVFIQKKITDDEEDIGEELKNARNKKGEDLKTIAKRIEIKDKYLQAIEENDYQKLPGDIYTENFLRIYSQYLGLNSDKILAAYHKNRETLKIFERKKFKKKRIIFTPKFFKVGILVSIVLVILVYLGVVVGKSILPPELTVINPVDNLITPNKEIEIFGRTEKNTQVTINGQPVFCDKNNEFKEKFVLQKGINIIEISAFKKHSRERIVLRKVLAQ